MLCTQPLILWRYGHVSYANVKQRGMYSLNLITRYWYHCPQKIMPLNGICDVTNWRLFPKLQNKFLKESFVINRRRNDVDLHYCLICESVLRDNFYTKKIAITLYGKPIWYCQPELFSYPRIYAGKGRITIYLPCNLNRYSCLNCMEWHAYKYI